jgi:recombination protein RecA
LDLDRLGVAQPESAEQAFEMIHRFVESGAVELVVVDSAAALTPEFELDAGLAADTTGLQSRVLGSELRKLVRAAARNGVCVLFLNQTRARLEGPGDLETSAGGPSLKLYAVVRIALNAAGKTVRFRVLKNKFGPAFQRGELRWQPGGGFVECP